MKILPRLFRRTASSSLPGTRQSSTPSQRIDVAEAPLQLRRASTGSFLSRLSSAPPTPEESRFKRRWGCELEMEHIAFDRAANAVRDSLPGSTMAMGSDELGCPEWRITDAKRREWKVQRELHDLIEVVTPTLKTREDLDQVKLTARKLREAGARASDRGGMHYHIESREFKPKQAVNMLTFIGKHEHHMYKALNISDARKEVWCPPLDIFKINRLVRNPPKTKAEFCDKYANRDFAGKNRGTNARNYSKDDGTFEFRYFNASLDDDDIERNHELVQALGHYGLYSNDKYAGGDITEKGSPEEFCAKLQLSPFTAALFLSPGNASRVAAASAA